MSMRGTFLAFAERSPRMAVSLLEKDSFTSPAMTFSFPSFLNHPRNKGKNISGISFTEMEQANITADHFHFPACNKYKLQTKKKIITPSKWRLPVNSIIMNGFSIYQKILLGGNFKRSKSFLPKYKVPISAAIIRIRRTMVEPKILLPETKAAIAKQSWFKGG